MSTPAAESPVAALEAKLRRYPAVRYGLVDGGIIIDAPNPGGFSVSLIDGMPEWVVGLGNGGLHEHFDDPDDALEFVDFCLSDRCRLRQTSWFGVFRRIIVEARDPGGWRTVVNFGTIGLPSWRWRCEALFQNTLVRMDGPGWRPSLPTRPASRP